MCTLPTTLSTVTAKTDLESEFSAFSAEQEAYASAKGKYEQKKPITVDKVTQEVHEYVCSDGSIGWQAFVTATIDGKLMSKSFGVGKEAKARSFDWAEVKDKLD